ncbi:MAG: type II toxin-antitoxin system VapC family toxin [Blastocatellales bacterium]
MLVDTSGFFALYSREDKNHSSAIELYKRSRQKVTTSYVLAEYVALALVRGLSRTSVLAFSNGVLLEEAIEIVWVNQEQHIQAVKLLQQRPDKTYSLCDAVSFVLMRERQINEALTTDMHFVQEGLVRLLEP